MKYSSEQIEKAIERWTKKLNEMADQDDRSVLINFIDGMWKVQDLTTGKFLFGGGNFLTVFERAQKDLYDAKIYANIEGQEVIIYAPKA